MRDAETSEQKYSRLVAMARPSPTWDLSPNDIAAIRWALTVMRVGWSECDHHYVAGVCRHCLKPKGLE